MDTKNNNRWVIKTESGPTAEYYTPAYVRFVNYYDLDEDIPVDVDDISHRFFTTDINQAAKFDNLNDAERYAFNEDIFYMIWYEEENMFDCIHVVKESDIKESLNESNKIAELNSISNQIKDLYEKIYELEQQFREPYNIDSTCEKLFLDTNPEYIELSEEVEDLRHRINDLRKEFEVAREEIYYNREGEEDYHTYYETVDDKLEKFLEPELAILHDDWQTALMRLRDIKDEALEKYKQYIKDQKEKSTLNATKQSLDDLRKNRSKLIKEISDEELAPILDKLSDSHYIEFDYIQFKEEDNKLLAAIPVSHTTDGDKLNHAYFDDDIGNYLEEIAKEQAETFADNVIFAIEDILETTPSDWQLSTDKDDITDFGYDDDLPVMHGDGEVSGDLYLYRTLHLEKIINK